MRTLVAVPISPTLNPHLKQNMLQLLREMKDVEVAIFDEKVEGQRLHKIANARNILIDKFLKPHHDKVLWIDADLIYFPTNLAQLLSGHGVHAPMCFIEGTKRFYDTAAFIQEGVPVFRTGPYYGNFAHEFPWVREKSNLIRCVSVGTCYSIPADVYRAGGRHIADAFMEHFSVCEKAREMGYPIVTHKDIFVYHADLPRYGEEWHSDDLTIFQNWHGMETINISHHSEEGFRLMTQHG